MDVQTEDFLAKIDRAYAVLQAQYEAKTANSRESYAEALDIFPAGITRSNLYFTPYPPSIASAEGPVLTDEDGNTYIDLISDFAVAQSGHSNSAIAHALKAQLDHGISYGARTQKEVRLAKLIKERLPSVERLRFTNSGTEAGMYAVLAARAFSKKPAVLVCKGGYHGGSMNFAANDPRTHLPFDYITVEFNDPDAIREAVRENRDRLACVVTELMMNSGGCIPATQAFADAVKDACAENDVLLIIDEVMTTRLAFNGLQGHFNLTPDLTTLGKIIGGGMPVGAFGGRADIMAQFDQTQPGAAAHNGSFNNNVMTMTAGAVALEQVLTAPVLEQNNQKGEVLRARLNAVLKREDVALRFSGMGSVMAIHVGYHPPTRFALTKFDAPIRKLFHMYCVMNGIWIAQRGMLALSVETTDAHCDKMVETLEAFCTAYRDILDSILVPDTGH